MNDVRVQPDGSGMDVMREFGQYRIDSLMGAGGMGAVYRAFDTRRDREVALKLLPDVVSDDEEYQRRFRRESYAVARLRDPHVIPIHDYGEIDGKLFIDMRLVDGSNLGELLATTGALPPARAVDLISQVAQALDAAHAGGLVHRDVKPSNILVTAKDFVYVVDFGIAYAVGHTRSRLTMTGATLGTIAYMAPERFENRPVEISTDVYSLACVLFECLTGTRPFAREDLPSLMFAHLNLEPPAASSISPGVPVELDAVIRRGMAKDPADRYASAGDLAAAAAATLVPAPPVFAAVPAAAEPAFTNGAGTLTAAPLVAELPTHRPGTPETTETEATEHLTHPTVVAQRWGPASDRAATGPSRPPVQYGPPTPPPGAFPPPAEPPTVERGGDGEDARPRSWRRAIAIALAILLTAALGAAIAIVVTRLSTPAEESPVAGAPGVVPFEGRAVNPGAAALPIANAVAQPTVNTTVPVGSTPGYMEIAPNGKYALIANRAAGVLTVYDTTRNAVTGTVPAPQGTGGPQFVSFNQDGSRAYVSIFTTDRSVNVVGVLDTTAMTWVATVPVGVRPFALDVTPDGKRVYVPNHDSGSISVIDTATNTVVNTIKVDPNPHWVDISRDGTRLYAANHESNLVTTIELPSERVLATTKVGTSPHSIVAHPSQRAVINVNYDSNSVSVIDTTSGAVIATVPTGHHPQDITLSADGKFAYLANVDDNAIQVFDTRTYEIKGTVPVGQSPTSVAVSPDGRKGYVTNLADGTVTVLNLASTA